MIQGHVTDVIVLDLPWRMNLSQMDSHSAYFIIRTLSGNAGFLIAKSVAFQ